jgi:hypothetical protein
MPLASSANATTTWTPQLENLEILLQATEAVETEASSRQNLLLRINAFTKLLNLKIRENRKIILRLRKNSSNLGRENLQDLEIICKLYL